MRASIPLKIVVIARDFTRVHRASAPLNKHDMRTHLYCKKLHSKPNGHIPNELSTNPECDILLNHQLTQRCYTI